ncbi:13696_t:CDS:2 [Funneliformis mosseae]|uniref:13696_t:CDS:1 n=1 Tax=Funneliformis mosseae TaxID=27381 RepID=A0A9N9CGB9_FUNMO|nr:13696_t:CDS:2 [Funneliformis mosseae]
MQVQKKGMLKSQVSDSNTQNLPHFYMRVVPKYKKNYGSLEIKNVLEKSIVIAEDAKKLF